MITENKNDYYDDELLLQELSLTEIRLNILNLELDKIFKD